MERVSSPLLSPISADYENVNAPFHFKDKVRAHDPVIY